MPETAFPLLFRPSSLLRGSKALCAFPLARNIVLPAPSPTPTPLVRHFPEPAKNHAAMLESAPQASFASAYAPPAGHEVCRRRRASNSAELKANAGGQHRGLGCRL